MALRRTHAQKIRIIILIVFMLVFPFLANRYFLTLANQVGHCYHWGHRPEHPGGLFRADSLGQGGLAVEPTRRQTTARLGIPWYLSIPLACLFTALISHLWHPSLRLKGLYWPLPPWQPRDHPVDCHLLSSHRRRDALVVTTPRSSGYS
jgi:branched-chain amino acid transport system permease protein